MKLNLRILVYLNPSAIDKTTHKFKLESDSGFILVRKSIEALNKIEDWHYYVLVPQDNIDTCWIDKPENVTLISYPYINDALNSRFHFDTNALNNYFSTYNHDIDLIWTMLPEHAGALRAFANKRREEIPVFSYIAWMDYKKSKGYEPSYLLRMLDGFTNSHLVGIQSKHMETFIKDELLKDYKVDYSNTKIIYPKTELVNVESRIGDIIGFPHRVSTESGYKELEQFIFNFIDHKLWISNLNGATVEPNEKLINKSFDSRQEYYEQLSSIRFGISYHTKYSMWSMSVLDMMACKKVVLAPNMNAFPEMFPEGYPFLFNDKDEFIAKLQQLESCKDWTLNYWGERNHEQVVRNYTWKKQADELSEYFYDMITTKKTAKTESVFEQIKKYKMVTKGDLINKNITDYGRMCSRAWNKARIELMRDYGVKDYTRAEHTTFYMPDYNPENGVEVRPERVRTPWDLKNSEKKRLEKKSKGDRDE